MLGTLKRLLKPKLPSSAQGFDIVKTWGPFTRFTITDSEGVPYLTRYYLLSTRWGKVYLHVVHRSDGDRELHDHPWRFISFLLYGPGYVEHQPDGSRKRFYSLLHGPMWRLIDLMTLHRQYDYGGWINCRLDPAKPHRLEVVSRSTPQINLLLVGPKRREWGFHVPPAEIDGMRVAPSDQPSRYVPGAFWMNHEAFLDDKFGEGTWAREPGYYEEEIRA